MSAPLPILNYYWYGTYPAGAGIIGDGPRLDRVFEATAYPPTYPTDPGVVVWVRGPMLRRDGTPGRVQRSIQVDVTELQPPWLNEVINDAHARLGVAPASKEPRSFAVGDRVTHPRYGNGVITEFAADFDDVVGYRVRWDKQAEVAPTHPGDWCKPHELAPASKEPGDVG